jgi:hypothetical protein
MDRQPFAERCLSFFGPPTPAVCLDETARTDSRVLNPQCPTNCRAPLMCIAVPSTRPSPNALATCQDCNAVSKLFGCEFQQLACQRRSRFSALRCPRALAYRTYRSPLLFQAPVLKAILEPFEKLVLAADYKGASAIRRSYKKTYCPLVSVFPADGADVPTDIANCRQHSNCFGTNGCA